jgi:hypothetical protein
MFLNIEDILTYLYKSFLRMHAEFFLLLNKLVFLSVLQMQEFSTGIGLPDESPASQRCHFIALKNETSCLG